MRFKSLISLFLLATVAALLAVTAVIVSPVYADPADQSVQSRSAIGNLSLESGYYESANVASWELTVTNHAILGDGVAAYDVKVQIYPLVLPGKSIRVPSGDSFDYSNGVWTIGSIPPEGSATLDIAPRILFEIDDSGSLVPRRACAVIIAATPTEENVCQLDKAVEIWFMERSTIDGIAWTSGDVAVHAGVNNRRPGPGEQVTFTVAAENANAALRFGGVFDIGFSHEQLDVEVRVELTPGLTFVTVPDGFVHDSSVRGGVWSVGHLYDSCQREVLPCGPPLLPLDKTGQFQIMVASDPPPLEELCLTAEVTNATPWFEFDLRKRENDIAKVCLGQDPPVVVSEGEIVLWWLHDCVGVNDVPCGTADDEIRLFARVNHGDISLPTGYRRDLSPYRSHLTYLDPESVVVQVIDPSGRQYDDNSHSLTDGTTVSWQTAREDSGKFNQEGVRVWYSRQGFNANIGDWNNLVRTVSVSGLDGAAPPGQVKVRHDSTAASTFYDPAPPSYTHMRAPFGLTSPATINNDYFLEFENLGTYVVNFNALANHTNGTGYPASGDYIFHVGPIAELAVMDVGAGSPLATPGQAAYTIQAANNGPDKAPAVRVTLTGVPEGAEAVTLDGTYRETSCSDGICQAEWTLGELPVSSSRPARGQSEHPTLTIIAPDGVPASDIQATIANTEDYSVLIDGVTHSTYYYDHIEENNTATIAAQPGAGGTPPGTPEGLRLQYFPSPPTGLVWWDPVETLNGWPVSHYDVWQSAAPCHDPAPGDAVMSYEGTLFREDLTPSELEEARCYRVRAVNTQGVAGYWSEQATASTGEQTVPRLSIRGGPSVSEGGTVNFTVAAFPAPVEYTVISYTVTEAGEFVFGDLGEHAVALNTAETEVSIPVRTLDDLADEEHGSVTVTLNAGEGYELSSSRSATVRVTDNDRSTVLFTDPLGGTTVSEGVGWHDVYLSVSPAPSIPFTIDYTLAETGTATENEDFRISGSGSVRAPVGAEGVTIRVQVLNDGVSEAEEKLALILSSSDDYKLTSQRSVYTLTITDDDGPRVKFASTEDSVAEADTTSNVTINLDPAPTSDVTVNYQVGGTATKESDFTMADYDSVTVAAGTASVDLPVSIKEDTDDENNETVILTLRGGSGYTLGGTETRKHTLTILDDDRASVAFHVGETTVAEGAGGTQNVRINLTPAAPAGGLTLHYQATGASTATRGASRDYTIDGYGRVTVDAGATQAFIPVVVRNDDENEDDETVVLTLTDRPGHYNVGATKTHTVTITDDDLSEVSLEKAEESIRESGGSRRAYVTVDPAPRRELTIGYSVGGTVAHDGTDYTIPGLTGTYGTVTVPQGSRRVPIPISIVNDTEVEGEERLTLTLSAAGAGYEFGELTRYTLTIEDDDAPVATFATSSGSIYENATDNVHEVTVNFSRAPESAVAIGYSVGGTVTAGEDGDYAALPGSVNVLAGETSATINVVISDDEDNEGNETVVLRLENSTEYTVGSPGEYRLTIIDDDNDGATPVASINAPNSSNTNTSCEATERELSCTPSFNVDNRRAYDTPTSNDYLDCFNSNPRGTGCYGDLPQDLDLILQYVGGTATVGEDFVMKGRRADAEVTAVGETFRITARANSARPSGMTSAHVAVFRVIRDGKSEGRETVIIRLLNGPGYRLQDGVEYEDFTVYIRD